MVTYLGSLVQLCCGGGRKTAGRYCGVCGECSQCIGHTGFALLTAACAFQVYTAQAPGCSAEHCPKWALCFVFFAGLSLSGPGSWVLCKGTDSVGCAFCAFPSLSSSGEQMLGKSTVPGGPCVLITSPVPVAQFPGWTVRVWR